MWKSQDPMTRLRIASPCQVPWEGMSGDDRTRHCASCDLNVYNFAEMTRSEIGELLMATEGRICARLYQRADGTLLTSDCPSGLQASRRRKMRWKTAALAALVSLSAFGACTTSTKSRFGRHSRMTLNVERVATPQEASFVGVVCDETGFPLPGVTVLVRDEVTQRETAGITDANGVFAISSIADGVYRVEVSLLGLEPMVTEHLTLKQNEVARAQVTLRFNPTVTITVGVLAVDPMMTMNPMATTYSQEFINTLPIGH